MTIIYFILLLSIIVVVHEFGHFIMAKLFKVYCYEFSIGMGPKLLSKKGKETNYVLRLLPIGGYVAMAGENDGMADEYADLEIPKNRFLDAIEPWKRIIIMVAGIVMNFILAWVIMTVFFLNQGVYPEDSKPIIGSVVENSPAEVAGIMPNDYVIRVELADGTVVKPKTFDDMSVYTMTSSGDVTYVVNRDGQELSLTVTPVMDEQTGAYISGIRSLPIEYKNVTVLNAPLLSAKYLTNMTHDTIVSIFRMFKGVGLNQVSGPVGIYSITDTYASLGFEYFMMLVAMMSLSVGIFNALPLPVLDGGRVVITIGEWITGKKLNQKVEIALMSLCWVLLIGLMLFATWNDITRLFR